MVLILSCQAFNLYSIRDQDVVLQCSKNIARYQLISNTINTIGYLKVNSILDGKYIGESVAENLVKSL